MIFGRARRARRRTRARGWRGPRSLRAIIALVLAILGLLGIVTDRVVRRSPAADADWTTYDKQTARLLRVIDGDTLEIDVPDRSEQTTRVRLLGIDAPELHNDTTGRPDYFAVEATDLARRLGAGQSLTINLDETRTRDRYGRLLAYVYLPDNQLLNELLIREGVVYAFRTYPHQMQAQFEATEHTARLARKGLWKAITVQQMPAWRQEWMREHRLSHP